LRVKDGDALATGLGAGAVVTVTFDVSNYINGRIRGNFFQDEEGTLNVLYGNDAANMDLDFEVPLDTDQPDYNYPFDIIVIQPFVRLTFTNGGVPSSLLHAYVVALPI
jgi:hypothetical protein